MMEGITLTPHQQEAVDWLVEQLVAGEPLVALRGLAGTGKTSVIPALQEALRNAGLPTTLGAPTHRAAMILRKKGLDAETIHTQALIAYFTADYRRACAWLGEVMPSRPDDTTAPRPDVDGLPWLVHEAVKPDFARGKALLRQRRYKARRRLASLGISGKDYFAGWAPKAGEGVLIIDEASMVGGKMLALCQDAYSQILLVGDPGQLPPVNDTPVLIEAPGIELTDIHRQAQDSPIVSLAFAARQGEDFWAHLNTDPMAIGAPVRVVDEVAAQRFLTCPLLVWRNRERVTTTRAIRDALGYPRDHLVKGEPLVCRATSPEDRALGFFNNGLYTITDVSPDDPRQVTVKDALDDVQTIRVHLEEMDGDTIDPRSIPFRFGYCLTVHTAQGGEWPRVYISLPELRAYVGTARRNGQETELAQWTYTAITRAKDTLRFLSMHTFTNKQERTSVMAEPTTIAPPSAPFLTAMPDPLGDVTPSPSAAIESIPGIPDQDEDIADPVVPETLVAALTTPPALASTPYETLLPLMQGFCDVLQKKVEVATSDHYRDLGRLMETAWSHVREHMEVLRDKNDHALYQFGNSLMALQEHGVPIHTLPYTADVKAYSPHGYPITIHVTQPTQADLLGELKELTDWLASKGCKPGD